MAVESRSAFSRRAGLLAAGLVGLIGIAVVLVSHRPAGIEKDRARLELPSDAPPDIKSAPVRTTSGGGVTGAAMGTTKGWFVEVADKSDPGRRAGLYLADSSEPLPNRQHLLTKPQAWSFATTGRAIHVTADRGQAQLPAPEKNARPQSAVLEGDVRIRVYNPVAGKTMPAPEPSAFADRTPDVIALCESLRYDETPGRLTSPGAFEIQSPELEFRGRGLTILINDVERRIEYLKIDRPEPGFKYRILPSVGATTTRPTPAAGTTAPAPEPPRPESQSPSVPAASASGSNVPASGPGGSPTGPVTTYYKIVVGGDVQVVFEGRTIKSDQAEAWLTVVGDSLAPNAMTPLRFEPAPGAGIAGPGGTTTSSGGPAATPTASETATKPAATSAMAKAAPQTQTLRAPDGRELSLTWTGAMEMRPLPSRPVELERDQLAVRFAAAPEKTVEFADPASRLSARGASLQYFATTARGVLTSAANVRATIAAENGLIVADRLELDGMGGVVIATGTGSLREGSVADNRSDSVPACSAEWSSRAEFAFLVSDAGVTSRLASARIVGDAVVRDGRSEFRAGEMLARFDTRAGRRTPILLAMTAEGGVELDDGRGGRLSCRTLDAAFTDADEIATESLLSSFEAYGAVSVARGSDTVECDSLSVRFTARAEGTREADVSEAIARGNVKYRGADGLFAQGARLHATPAEQLVKIEAGPDDGGASVGQNKSVVSGRMIELRGGEAQRITVTGAGLFRHSQLGADGSLTQVNAAWSENMRFDDATGVLEAEGDIVATAESGASRRDQLQASSLRATLTKSAESDARSAEKPMGGIGGVGASTGNRLLRQARVLGSAAKPASVESRQVAARDTQETLASVVLIESQEIVADVQESTLDVPTAGVLFTSDRGAGRAANANADAAQRAATSEGDTRIRWSQSLRANRATGEARILGDVKVRHLDRRTGVLTDIESDSIDAKIRGLGAASPGAAAPESAQLESAMASGSVWIRSGSRELSGMTASFDTNSGDVLANGDGANDVTLVDSAQGSPISARSILWNIRTGRIEVRTPSSITAPR